MCQFLIKKVRKSTLTLIDIGDAWLCITFYQTGEIHLLTYQLIKKTILDSEINNNDRDFFFLAIGNFLISCTGLNLVILNYIPLIIEKTL